MRHCWRQYLIRVYTVSSVRPVCPVLTLMRCCQRQCLIRVYTVCLVRSVCRNIYGKYGMFTHAQPAHPWSLIRIFNILPEERLQTVESRTMIRGYSHLDKLSLPNHALPLQQIRHFFFPHQKLFFFYFFTKTLLWYSLEVSKLSPWKSK